MALQISSGKSEWSALPGAFFGGRGDSRLDLYHLKWTGFLVPASAIFGLLLLFNLIDPATAHSLEGALAAGTVIAAGAYLFSSWFYGIVCRSEEKLLAKQRQIQALNQAALDISRELDLETVLQKVADAARELLQAEYCALQVMAESGYPPSMVTSGLDPAVRERLGELPHGWGVLGPALREGRPVRVPEIPAHPASVGFPPGHPSMTSFLGVPIIARGKVLGQLFLSNKRTAPEFSAEDEEVATMLANQAAVAIENSWLYQQARRTNAYLNSVIAANHDAIVVLCHDGRVQLWNAGAHKIYGLTEAEAVGRVLPMVPPQERQAVLAMIREVLQGAAVTGWEAVHQRKDGSQVPVLLTFSRIDRGACQEECVVMSAKDITTAKHMEAQRRRLALLEERERISMDLHDGAIQSLYAVGLALGTTRMVLPADQEEVRERIGYALQQVNDVIRQLREYIVHLRAEDAARSLRETLPQIVERLEEDGRLKVRLTIEGDADSLPDELSLQLLHLAGEAASNVLRHAEATEAEIKLVVSSRDVTLTVRDNGKGFNPSDAGAGARYGLRNMVTRAQLLGGSCEVVSEKGRGTEVRVVAPIAAGRWLECRNGVTA